MTWCGNKASFVIIILFQYRLMRCKKNKNELVSWSAAISMLSTYTIRSLFVRLSDYSDLLKTLKFKPPAHIPTRDLLLLFLLLEWEKEKERDYIFFWSVDIQYALRYLVLVLWYCDLSNHCRMKLTKVWKVPCLRKLMRICFPCSC